MPGSVGALAVEGSSGGGYDSLHLGIQGGDLFQEAYTSYGGDPDTRVADRLAKLHADPAVAEAIVVEQSLASAADTLLAHVVLPPEAAPRDLPLFLTMAPPLCGGVSRLMGRAAVDPTGVLGLTWQLTPAWSIGTMNGRTVIGGRSKA